MEYQLMTTTSQRDMICDLFWQFHNDRLADPSIKEMKPYIDPIQDYCTAQVIEELEWFKGQTPVGEDRTPGMRLLWRDDRLHAMIDRRIKELKATLKGKIQ